MDKLSIAGVVLAVLAIFVGMSIEGGDVTVLFQLPAFIIVFGGTLGAVMLQSSRQQFFHSLTLVKWVFVTPAIDMEKGVKDMIDWAEKARQHGFLTLENIAQDEHDDYTNKGLNLLVDGNETDIIRDSLDMDIVIYREHFLRSAKIFESMGGYSPTIGIIGAVLGLIQAMTNITDPTLLGHGIATAFVATIYGVGFANFIYLPIANKLRTIISQQTLYREMIAEGLVAIANGENPRAIELKLSVFRL
jgi:chemotaxis protein MotA